MTSIPLSDLEQSPSAKFTDLGDAYSGKITDIRETMQTDMDTGAPLTFADGTPRKQWVITVATGDGDVALYAKGGNYTATAGTGDAMLKAIGKAAAAAGASSIEVGATLAVAYTGSAKIPGRQYSAKLYTAEYRAPAPAGISSEDLFG